MISDVRTKLESDEAIRRDYDSLIKDMVLLGSGSALPQRRQTMSDVSDDDAAEPSMIQPVLDLMGLLRTLIELIGRNVDYQSI